MLSGLSASGMAQENAAVRTDRGIVQGVTDRGVLSFKGIPYAAPPVGAARWREPLPVEKWDGTKRADVYGSACIQKPGLSEANGAAPGSLSEDCLYLNVWTPKLDARARLPVIVWIHGGAYIFGAGGLALYDGTPIAKKGSVFVSINYRLGALGFFAHPAIEKATPGGPMNFGLLDQVAALKWVRSNIARFGGDPGNVTIMGQSAGGRSVLAHFASPLSRGLFHKGVALSAYILPDARRDKALAIGTRIASLVAHGDATDLDALRALPAARFEYFDDKEAQLGPVPIVGDAMLPKSIADTFAAGEEARLPLIVGNTSDDASVIAAFGIEPEKLIDNLGAAGLGLRLLYPGAPEGEPFARQALRDVVFTMNARWIAHRHARWARTWRAYFDYVPAHNRASWMYGVPHGGDVPFYLDTGDIYEGTREHFTAQDRAIAKVASDYIVAFARTGTPTARTGPVWQRDRRLRDRSLVFGREKVEPRSNFMRIRLDTMTGVTRLLDAFACR